MDILVFGKEGCAACQTTKNKFNHYISKFNYQEKVNFNFFNMDTIDGLTEGAVNNVLKIPTTLFKKDGEIVAKWEGDVPNREEFEVHFSDL